MSAHKNALCDDVAAGEEYMKIWKRRLDKNPLGTALQDSAAT